MKVVNNEGKIQEFRPQRIKNKLLEETSLYEEEVVRITNNVVAQLRKQYEDTVSTSAIRSIINSQLIKKGFLEEEKHSRKLGMSVNDYEQLLKDGCKDNANISYNPEMIAKYAYDSISKEYALLKMPEECSQAHIDGYIHIHDLEYYNTRPNCFNYDLRFFAKNGLKVDGIGRTGAVAKPAKSLEVLLNHLLQAFMAGATVFSGGQGFVNFNTLLSPFAKGRSYKDIKQAIQGFIYNCNMSLICRGGQVLFSSIGVDLSTPEYLADQPAIGPSGIPVGTYKDYTEEADLIFRAVCEVLSEKDGWGRYFRFPNTLFNIRKGDFDEYKGNCKILHELGANNPTIYYNNCVSLERTTMGCRTSLPLNYSGDYEADCTNTGNFMYNTLNLPLIAYESEDEQEFFDTLRKYVDISRKSLMHRLEEVKEKVYDNEMSTFLIQTDKDSDEPLWDYKRTTFTIGFCGLHEALIELYGEGLPEQTEKGKQIIEFLNDIIQEYKAEDGLRWSVIGSPAESTAHRFAEINKAKHPDATVQGTEGHYYLTNSSHIPVGSTTNLVEHIKNAGEFHNITLGGNILHIWLGESQSIPEGIWSFNKKILEHTDTIFWAYSKSFTFCEDCQFTINQKEDVCPVCDSENVLVYDRITGYYLGVNTFNDGKSQEFKDRYRQKIVEDALRRAKYE